MATSGPGAAAGGAATGSAGATHPELRDITVLVPDGARTDSLSAVAYYRLRDMIVTLELEPGALLSERDLMDRLGLGRTPIREALRHLARENLVAIYPRRGMVVAPIDVRDLAAISEIRIELEGFAAHLAAGRADPDDREATAALATELEETVDETDTRTLIRFDQRIHRHVHRCAHNPFLEATLDNYLVLSLRLWFLGLHEVHRLDEAVAEHREMLDAILSGDADRAETIVRGHVAGFEREIRAVL